MADARRTLIFDVDGTLVDSTYQHAMAWGRAFRSCGVEVSMWRIHRAIGMGGDRLVTAVCDEVIEERIGDTLRTLWAEAFDDLRGEVRALPGARDLVHRLHEQGHRVCVASSGSRTDTDAALDIVGVRRLLDGVTTGDDAESSKPSPDTVERAWQGAGGGPAGVVGDSVYDIQAAESLGLPCFAVRTGGVGTEELLTAGAALVTDDLTGLLDADWRQLVPANGPTPGHRP